MGLGSCMPREAWRLPSPQPLQSDPHALYLLRGLVWGQHYRHSNPQCEGGMPGSFELRDDMGADRLQALEDWLRVEGAPWFQGTRLWLGGTTSPMGRVSGSGLSRAWVVFEPPPLPATERVGPGIGI